MTNYGKSIVENLLPTNILKQMGIKKKTALLIDIFFIVSLIVLLYLNYPDKYISLGFNWSMAILIILGILGIFIALEYRDLFI